MVQQASMNIPTGHMCNPYAQALSCCWAPAGASQAELQLPDISLGMQDDYPPGVLRNASGGGLTPLEGAVVEFQALLKAWVPTLLAELGILTQLLQPLLSRTGTPSTPASGLSVIRVCLTALAPAHEHCL